MSVVERVLRERFGLESLRPLQSEVIANLLEGRDALVVLPTGSGKSLCFQLPAVLDEAVGAFPDRGVTLVLSPLIALMEDQVSALRRRGLRAEFVNSTIRREERERKGHEGYDTVEKDW